MWVSTIWYAVMATTPAAHNYSTHQGEKSPLQFQDCLISFPVTEYHISFVRHCVKTQFSKNHSPGDGKVADQTREPCTALANPEAHFYRTRELRDDSPGYLFIISTSLSKTSFRYALNSKLLHAQESSQIILCCQKSPKLNCEKKCHPLGKGRGPLFKAEHTPAGSVWIIFSALVYT